MLRLGPNHPLNLLAATANVEIRVKNNQHELMHDKESSADAALLRTGGANASVSGLKSQDNSLLLIRDAAAAAAFDHHFEAMWARHDNSNLYSAANR
jgi:phosphatidylserine/phosphatidylglycerophosphate/cardiolipin synthase-like enzyme